MPVQRDALPTREAVYHLCLLPADEADDGLRREQIEQTLRTIEATCADIQAQISTFHEEKTLYGTATQPDDWLPKALRVAGNARGMASQLQRAIARLDTRAMNRLAREAADRRAIEKATRAAAAEEKTIKDHRTFVKICHEWLGDDYAQQIWDEVNRRRCHDASTIHGG